MASPDNNIKKEVAPSPPSKQLIKQMESLSTTATLENHIKCEIKDIQEFKWCLDSVKFPTGPKKFNVRVPLILTEIGRRIFRAHIGHHA